MGPPPLLRAPTGAAGTHRVPCHRRGPPAPPPVWVHPALGGKPLDFRLLGGGGGGRRLPGGKSSWDHLGVPAAAAMKAQREPGGSAASPTKAAGGTPLATAPSTPNPLFLPSTASQAWGDEGVVGLHPPPTPALQPGAGVRCIPPCRGSSRGRLCLPGEVQDAAPPRRASSPPRPLLRCGQCQEPWPPACPRAAVALGCPARSPPSRSRGRG